MQNESSIDPKIIGVGMIGDELLKPTEIYTSPVLEMIQKCKINGNLVFEA